MDIQCFMIEPTEKVERSLRRYVGSSVCDSNEMKYHNISVRIEDGPLFTDEHGCYRTEPMIWPRTDERWPKQCSCGYEFKDDEGEWQLFYEIIYCRVDNGEEFSLRTAPPGAMFRATWHEPYEVGDDGIALGLVLPPQKSDMRANVWIIDGPASSNPSGKGWTRTGTPPNITANPSILSADYHGWLRNGVLVEC